MTAQGLPDAAWLLALVGLPGMGPARLRPVLAGRSPGDAWEAVRRGAVDAPGDLGRMWRGRAAGTDVATVWAAHQRAGVRVLAPGDPGWPTALVDDPEPPALLFTRGDPGVLERPAVAIVGTRRASTAGRLVAEELGHDLARAGVCVVSGLALGIDGAAHRGALAADGPLAGVVGTGLDVVYPQRHAELWRLVGERGVLVSEHPLGTRPERWQFPARNRVIAGLAQVVVVVESHATGGSLHTVESALERDRVVMAVPGPVRSPASAGTNGLLVSGAAPARDAADVLAALGISAGAAAVPAPAELPAGDRGLVLDAVGWESSSLEEVANRCGAPLGPVAVHLAALESDGWVAQRQGWWERAR